MSMETFWLDPGTVCVKLAGRDAGKLYVVVQPSAGGFVTVSSGDRERRCNVRHLEATGDRLDPAALSSAEAIAAALSGLAIEPRVEKPPIGMLCRKTGGRDAGRVCVVVLQSAGPFVTVQNELRRVRANVRHLETLGTIIPIPQEAPVSTVAELLAASFPSTMTEASELAE
jgi:ribosomal protein L14E/L6E/L27E